LRWQPSPRGVSALQREPGMADIEPVAVEVCSGRLVFLDGHVVQPEFKLRVHRDRDVHLGASTQNIHVPSSQKLKASPAAGPSLFPRRSA
jgi:hypothetical protein